MSWFINGLRLYHPCAAKTYTSSKSYRTTSWTSNRILTLVRFNHSEKTTFAKVCGITQKNSVVSSITRGLLTVINTIRKRRHVRATGKQRQAKILRTLHTGPKMNKVVKSEIIFTYSEMWEQNRRLTTCTQELTNSRWISHHFYLNKASIGSLLLCYCIMRGLTLKILLRLQLWTDRKVFLGSYQSSPCGWSVPA